MEPFGTTMAKLHSVSRSAEPREQNAENIEAIRDGDPRLFFNNIALGTPCVFLCTGRPEKCRIVQVTVRDDDTHSAILDKMGKARAKSRTWLPFRRVTKVEEVRIRFSGLEKRRAGEVFVGVYEVLDTERLRRSLDETLKTLGESIGAWQEQELSSLCGEDYMSGEWEHSPGCPSLYIPFRNCDVKEFDDVQYRLRSLSLLPMLTLAFQTPLLANGQRLHSTRRPCRRSRSILD
ncbi:hypothetical protein BR93DRAFT_203172 [Coniochaeta sp. PMI_546]|nr:hypothetical protein BR93DRAFT_203172 [Coniochaeta sp. PMI_546]